MLGTVEIWRSSFLANLRYFDEQRVLEFGVEKVLGVIQDTRAQLRGSRGDYASYGCFEKLGQFLEGKTSRVVAVLSELMGDAILSFDPASYGSILRNYTALVQRLDLYSLASNLPLLLENNLNRLLRDSFTPELDSVAKFEGASGTEYLQFFERLLLGLEHYLHNWHLATRWHLEHSEEGPFGLQVKQLGEEFLRFRKTVWAKSEEKIADLLSKSFRFYTLSLNQRAMLMLKLYDFARAGNFFASSRGKMLPKILRQKLRDENELFLKQVGSLTKFALNRELRCCIFEELLTSLSVPESYVCELTPEELCRLDQLINAEVPLDYQPAGLLASGEDRELELEYDRGFAFQKNSACFYIQQGVIELARRAYIQPRMCYEVFLKCKELLELVLYWMFRLMCSDLFRKQLFEDWGGCADLRFQEYRDVEANAGVLEYFIECAARQAKCPKLRREMTRIVSRLEAVGHKTLRREELPLSNIVFVNENVCALVNWLKHNAGKLFPRAAESELQQIRSDLDELFDITVELAGYTYSSHFEDLKVRYQPVQPLVADLKWDIKKYSSDTAAAYRDYKSRLAEIAAGMVTGLRELKYPQQINARIEGCLADVFFQALLDIYARVEKVNENGKQLMRLDAIELAKSMESLGVPTSSSYRVHLDAYLSMGFTRDTRDLERAVLQSQVLRLPLRPTTPSASGRTWSTRRSAPPSCPPRRRRTCSSASPRTTWTSSPRSGPSDINNGLVFCRNYSYYERRPRPARRGPRYSTVDSATRYAIRGYRAVRTKSWRSTQDAHKMYRGRRALTQGPSTTR